MVERSKGCSSSPPDSHPCPWLMFSHGKATNIQTFYNPAKKSCLRRRLPDLCNGRIRASFDSWVIVGKLHYEEDDGDDEDGDGEEEDGVEDNDGEDDDEENDDGEDNNEENDDGEEDYFYDYFCLNLESMEKIQLPSFGGERFQECILSASPLLPNCIVAFVLSTDEGNNLIKCWRPNQEGWIERVMESRLTDFAVCKGKIYGFQNFRNLMVLDIVEDQIQIERVDVGPVPNPMLVGIVRIGTYLIESCGELFLIKQLMLGASARRVRSMEVYKLETRETRMEWIKTKNIGDRVFFMNNGFNCFSCSATHAGLTRNSIYFTLDGRDRTLYRYNIAENRLYKSLPCRGVVHNLDQICWLII